MTELQVAQAVEIRYDGVVNSGLSRSEKIYCLVDLRDYTNTCNKIFHPENNLESGNQLTDDSPKVMVLQNNSVDKAA